ncbi:GH39 family glycosyl hydrolase [Larkinella sp.]|uniref:GH39 family glycosyl hydrolase n=1 Tax=Larkinella sp. TaxID=2034517 RepID=UPI003BAB7DB9
MENNRRNFLKILSILPFTTSLKMDSEPVSVVSEPANPLKKLGSVRLKKPSEITSSPFGIGCETLDRDLWKPKEVYPWIDNLPVKWGRLQTGWGRVEREKGKYDWAWLDESVDGLVSRGVKPFFNVGYGNTNYTTGEVGHHPLDIPVANEAWKRYVTALTKRYKDKIKHYEIWNEPNLGGFWAPDKPNAKKYVQLVRETAPIIRKNCPDAVIVGGVVSRMPAKFIRELFEAGLADLIDIFSFHPYTTIPESYSERTLALRKLVDHYNPKIKIWQGENGFPSDPNSTGFPGEGPWTEAIQAKIMLRRLLTDCSLDLPMTLWFLIVDLHDYPKGSGKVNYKGILRQKPEIKPKIAYKALQHLGSLVHGDVHTRGSIIHAVSGKEPVAEKDYQLFGDGTKKSLSGICSTVLNTDNGPVLAYWSGEKAADSKPADSIHLYHWDWEGPGFQEPVLVDLITGDILELTGQEKLFDNDKYRVGSEAQLFRQLPLQDYPMLIMEKSKVV